MCIAQCFEVQIPYKNVKTDINSTTDFQNMPEYTNNKEPGLCVFESDIFIN